MEPVTLVSQPQQTVPSNSVISSTTEKTAIAAALHDAFHSTATAARRSASWSPLSQPVSLESNHLKHLKSHRDEYLVSLKADGTRFALVLMKIENAYVAVMVGRDWTMYEVPMLAQPDRFEGKRSLAGTVLDGELVSGTNKVTFYVFDALVVGGKSVTNLELTQRMELVYAGIDEQHGTQSVEEMEERVSRHNVMLICDAQLTLGVKRWWLPADLGTMWNAKSTIGAVDGIIFMPRNKVVAGTDRRMLKYKLHHTVDLLIKIHHSAASAYVLVNGELQELNAALLGTGKRKRAEKAMSLVSNQLLTVIVTNQLQCVVECRLALETDRTLFHPIKERVDKVQPNDIITIKGCIAAARDKISLTALREHLEGQDVSLTA
jgi:hypothetical protein